MVSWIFRMVSSNISNQEANTPVVYDLKAPFNAGKTHMVRRHLLNNLRIWCVCHPKYFMSIITMSYMGCECNLCNHEEMYYVFVIIPIFRLWRTG